MARLWLLLLVGCNQVYGLDETKLRPEEAGIVLPQDIDKDGIPDETDLCPGVPDVDPGVDQKDRDKDGFGDACDACPAIPTLVNHDEDGDSFGDACDVCPNDPDFQVDGGDRDGVGELCDNDTATKNELLLFDPFISIGPEYEQTGVWSVNGDAISGTVGSTLTTTTVMLDGAKPFVIAVGVALVQPLSGGSNGIRLDLIDASGVALGCGITCTNFCRLGQDPVGASDDLGLATPPLTMLFLRRTPYLDSCVFDMAVVPTPDNVLQPTFGLVRVRLTGAPNIRFRFLTVWQ